MEALAPEEVKWRFLSASEAPDGLPGKTKAPDAQIAFLRLCLCLTHSFLRREASAQDTGSGRRRAHPAYPDPCAAGEGERPFPGS